MLQTRGRARPTALLTAVERQRKARALSLTEIETRIVCAFKAALDGSRACTLHELRRALDTVRRLQEVS